MSGITFGGYVRYLSARPSSERFGTAYAVVPDAPVTPSDSTDVALTADAAEGSGRREDGSVGQWSLSGCGLNDVVASGAEAGSRCADS